MSQTDRLTWTVQRGEKNKESLETSIFNFFLNNSFLYLAYMIYRSFRSRKL